MLILALTGGIAMGKSTVARKLCAALPDAAFFDADAAVRQLLTDPEICRRIAREFGESAIHRDGRVDRPYLRRQVFDSAERRAALESILHPEVRREFESRAQSAAERRSVFIADIPLLYESAHPYPRDLVLVVGCDAISQRARLLRREGIDDETAAAIVRSQLPIEKKVALADHVIWNSGSKKTLENQTEYFIQWLKKKT